MLAIEPNDYGDELDGVEEIPLRLIVTRGDGAELLERGEEVLDQVVGASARLGWSIDMGKAD